MSTFNMWNVSCMLIFSVACLSWVTPSHALDIQQMLIELQGEVDEIKNKLAEVVRATTCPENFTRFESSCYYFGEPLPRNGGDWSYAISQCHMIGSNLVSIETKQEAEFIRVHTNSDWHYTSAHKHESYWVWDAIGMNMTDGYQPWYPGEPNDSDKHCAVLQGGQAKLYDWHCTVMSGFRYICETKLSACI